jgi:DNA-binding HxlR family transcriptional regulator
MQSYRQYCPVAKAHEILGDRWTMLIVRELVAGLQNFNEIARGLPGISRSLLSERLLRLEASGVIKRVPRKPRGYHYELTPAGRELEGVVVAMGSWAVTWAFGLPNEDELDPGLLLWWMERRLNLDALPNQRITIAFDFLVGRKGQFWFVVADGEASTCLEDPGFEIAILVVADLSAFYQVWLGKMTLRHAVSKELIRIEGTPKFERAFESWFLWSPMAEFVSAELLKNRQA